MNNPFGKIPALARQVSRQTRSAVEDGVRIGRTLANNNGLLKTAAKHAAIGAAAGAAAGAGYSGVSGDGRMGRDMAVGAAGGGLLGAGWAGYQYRANIAETFSRRGVGHGPQNWGRVHAPGTGNPVGPAASAAGAVSAAGSGERWGSDEFVAKARAASAEERARNLSRSVEWMSSARVIPTATKPGPVVRNDAWRRSQGFHVPQL